MSAVLEPGLVERAWKQAEAAAVESRVTVALIEDMAGAVALEQLSQDVWQTGPQDAPMPAVLSRSLSFAGSYVAGAYGDDGELLGASVAFCTGYGLHSHISGVRPAVQDRRIGSALKLHQRWWGLSRGLRYVTWTFDPLVRRNAWFNLVKLGGVGEEYLRDFYGPMTGLNAGDLSDRMVIRWDLAREDAAEPLDEAELVAGGAVVALDAGPDGVPFTAPVAPDRPVVLRLPQDIVALRASRPEVARAWRIGLRETLEPAFAQGRELLGMTRSGAYVLGPQHR